MFYVVDVQGFKGSSQSFILKELSIISLLNDDESYYYLFKPPCQWEKLYKEEKKTNGWLINNYHGIAWEDGSQKFKDIIKILQHKLRYATMIFVKGYEKKKWLEPILPGKYILDLGELGCPSIHNLEMEMVNCNNHSKKKNGICATKNVHTFRKWMLSRSEYIQNMMES